MSEVAFSDGTTSFRLTQTSWEDEHWVGVRAEARTNWFAVRMDRSLYRNETQDLAKALRRLHQDGFGSHVFLAMENWMELTFAMAKRGELAVTVRLQSEPDYLNEVKVVLHLDQSYLPELAAGFEALSGP